MYRGASGLQLRFETQAGYQAQVTVTPFEVVTGSERSSLRPPVANMVQPELIARTAGAQDL